MIPTCQCRIEEYLGRLGLLVHYDTYLPVQDWRVSRPAWLSRPLWYLPASAGLKSISASLVHSSTMVPTCQCRIEEYLSWLGPLIHYSTYLPVQGWRVSRLAWPSHPLWYLPASTLLKIISTSLAHLSAMIPTPDWRVSWPAWPTYPPWYLPVSAGLKSIFGQHDPLVPYDTYLPVQGWRVSWPGWPTRPLWYLPASAGLKSISACLAYSSTMIPTCQYRIEEYLGLFGPLVHYDTYLPVQGWRVSQPVWPTRPLWYLPASTGLKSISASLAHSSTMVPTCQCRVEEYLSWLGLVVHYDTYLPVQGWRVSRPVWPTRPLIPTCQCRVEEYLSQFGPLVHYGTYLPVQGWRVSRPVWPTRPLWYLPASAGLKSISAGLA